MPLSQQKLVWTDGKSALCRCFKEGLVNLVLFRKMQQIEGLMYVGKDFQFD